MPYRKTFRILFVLLAFAFLMFGYALPLWAGVYKGSLLFWEAGVGIAFCALTLLRVIAGRRYLTGNAIFFFICLAILFAVMVMITLRYHQLQPIAFRGAWFLLNSVIMLCGISCFTQKKKTLRSDEMLYIAQFHPGDPHIAIR